MNEQGIQQKTNYFWQASANGQKHYVESLDWLLRRAKKVRLIEIFAIRPQKKPTKLLFYLEDGILFHATFDNYEEAKQFAVRPRFNHSNKEIHST